MIASLSVVGPLKQSTVIAVVLPVIVLGIPISARFCDFQKAHQLKANYGGGQGHLHHHLMALRIRSAESGADALWDQRYHGMAAVLVSRELYERCSGAYRHRLHISIRLSWT